MPPMPLCFEETLGARVTSVDENSSHLTGTMTRNRNVRGIPNMNTKE